MTKSEEIRSTFAAKLKQTGYLIDVDRDMLVLEQAALLADIRELAKLHVKELMQSNGLLGQMLNAQVRTLEHLNELLDIHRAQLAAGKVA